ncbi:hypothetical protein HK101_003106 [Irineochytrium annulatum]|nr:hypothetical protein HK101_003106 [Irineochytrium annulatum]
MPIDDYKSLADMNSRTSCPRCEGYGFVHDGIDKHDKADVKVLSSLSVCGGSGVVVGKIGCRPCKARGFLHPVSVHLKEHSTLESVRCVDCIECRDCFGAGVLDKRQKPKTTALQKPLTPTTATSLPSGPNTPTTPGGPLLPGILPPRGHTQPAIPSPQSASVQSPLTPGIPPPSTSMSPLSAGMPMPGMYPSMPGAGGAFAPNPLMWAAAAGAQRDSMMPGVAGAGVEGDEDSETDEEEEEVQRVSGETLYSDDHLKNKTCPRCEGHGWKHETSSKHDKIPTIRCKNCASCKGMFRFLSQILPTHLPSPVACTGAGTVDGKIACPLCETRGFVHASTERDHDVPQKLRCFFCKDCNRCKGRGVIDDPEVARLAGLRAAYRREEERRAAERRAKEQRRAARAARREAAASLTAGIARAGVKDMEDQRKLFMTLLVMMQQQVSAAAAAQAAGDATVNAQAAAALPMMWGAGMLPHVPVPPVLPVFTCKARDGEEGVRVVGVPGVGLVPVEQVMRMQIPVLVNPPAAVQQGMYVYSQQPSQQGMPGMQGNQMGPGGMPGPAYAHVPTESPVAASHREAALRDVWG